VNGKPLPGAKAKAPKRRKGSMNSVHLIGRLATDVDVKEVNGGSKVSSFILAVDRTAEEADFALLRRAQKA
jgi:single-stranded DNA-binding protein